MLTMHHIVSDGWSMGVLVNEVSALYGAFRSGAADPLAPLGIQYADYAQWQRERLSGEELERQTEYWKQALAGAPERLELPTDRVRPLEQQYAGESVEVQLDLELSRALKALSQRHGATVYMTLLAGWAAVLGRLAGQEQVRPGVRPWSAAGPDPCRSAARSGTWCRSTRRWSAWAGRSPSARACHARAGTRRRRGSGPGTWSRPGWPSSASRTGTG